MSILLNPYLTFKNNARQAMEFYQSVFGGELKMNTFKEFNASMSPAEDNLIMHAELKAGDGLTLMASDTPERMEYKPGTNISMSINGEDEKELKGYFGRLSSGGMVSMPLEKQVWGDVFGMVTDKFGISWMVNINSPKM
jgi:PhnB protein